MLATCAANAAYLVGLEASVPGGACLVAGTGWPLAQMLRRAGIVAMTIDEHPEVVGAVTGPLSSGVVLGAAPVAELLADQRCDAVLPFKSGARLWKMAEWQGLRVLASPHRLTRQLENKLALAELAAAADARVPDTVTVRLDDHLVAAAREDGIALPRVFQPAVGFAGAGTVLLRDAHDVERLVRANPDGVGKLVEFVHGDPVTVNGVVLPPGSDAGADGDEPQVLVGMVARQLTGIEGLTPTDFGSCGNDWAQPPPRAAVVAVRSLAHRVGEVLRARGFAGAFGIDVVLPSGGGVPALIEINPRWTASLALQVELQAMQGLPTLLDAHLRAFGYRLPERAPIAKLVAAYGPEEDCGCTRSVPAVSTVIAYNSTAGDVHVDSAFEPGVWRVDDPAEPDQTLVRVRDGWRVADLAGNDEMLVLPQGPVRPVPSGGYLVRVVRRGAAAADAGALSLQPEVDRVVRAVVRRVQRPAD